MAALRFIELTTRTRILISVGLLTFLYVLFQQLNLNQVFAVNQLEFDLFNPIILAAVAYILMYWISEFRIKGERFITILAFPSVGIFVFSLFVELIISTIFGQLSVIFLYIFTGGLFSFFSYILFSTANILNVGFEQEIPLGQAGRAAYYILNMLTEYLLFLIIISNEINIFIEMTLIGIVVFYFVTSTLWTIKQRVGRRMLVGIISSFLFSFTYFVLAMWPIDNTYISLLLLIFLYVLLGVALETRDKVSNWIWVEYGFLIAIATSIIIIVSNWGINGTLI